MGGDAVVRLGANPDVPIDLLAPIDPVGNRSSPVFDRVDPRNNWTRWRVADPMLGWQQRDCIRNRLGGCKNFGTVRNPEYRCAFRQIQDSPPIRSSREPRVCPGSAQLALDPNPPVIGNNVRFLYLRWQKESAFPFDFGNNIQLRRTVPLNNDNMREGNYQKEVSKNGSGVQDRNKTCSDEEEIDPRDPYINCNSGDGHGEIVGFRGFSERRPIPYGLQAQNWPLYFDGINANLRRQKLIEMATAPSPDPNKTIYGPHNWEHEPLNPNLDLVVDDLVTMLIKHINENQ